MSGRKQFDESKALQAAMTLFWQRGYEAASLSDLESVTGLNKSSIYNTYQNKASLFTRCLEQFGKQYGDVALAKLEHPDFKTAISQFFEQILQMYSDPALPRGCLVSIAAVELSGTDASVGDWVTKGLDGMRESLERRCEQAVKDGQLDSDTNCAAMAAMFLSISQGGAVLNRGYGDTDMARQAVDGMLCAIIRQ